MQTLTPYRLYDLGSLMNLYDVGALTDSHSFMCSFGQRLRDTPDQMALRPQQLIDMKARITGFLGKLEEMDLQVGATLVRQVLERLADLPVADGMHLITGQNKLDLDGVLGTLANMLGMELTTKLVMIMPAEKARYFQPKDPPFGSAVATKFANASEDIDEAGNCFALARYTACVFHLMRVLELGVQEFGQLLQVTLLDKRGREKNWQNILDEANKAIRSLDQSDAKTKKYAAISANLYNVKQGWRNDVMHPKATYTEDEARGVLDATKTFMTELASVV